ncbi:MAG: peptide chain release factor N(5)-glutamine methyltransferase [Parasporobacterium sp.]|nr:peptide chain release factor N(5)-glutamine methyltransferase [Parasporobacterium sp.]
MTLEELYKHGTAKLKEADIENPSVDAFYMLEYAAGLNRTTYLMYKDQPVSDQNRKQYMDLIEERMKRIPYQYIIGKADFAGLTFEVNPSVLIPRLDTEVLFEQTLRHLTYRSYVLDLCTGSGALGIALKRYRPDIHMVISDISEDALSVARRNLAHNHLDVAERTNSAADPADLEQGYNLNFGVRVIQSDLFDNLAAEEAAAEGKELTGRFDLIVSNPPYVTDGEYEELMPEVKDYEPRLALTAGTDGLDCYRRIASGAPAFLKPGGRLLLEIGCRQAEAVSELLSGNGFTDLQVIRDLAGLDRVITGTRTENNNV